MMMDEIRIDCAHPSPEEAELSKQQMQTLFKLNHTMPATEGFDALVRELFPDMGEDSRVTTPLNGVRFNKVKIGRKV